MSDFFHPVEQAKSRFLARLKRIYSFVDIENVAIVASKIDEDIKREIRSGILSNASSIFNIPGLVPDFHEYITLKRSRFQLSMGDDVLDREAVVYAFTCCEPEFNPPSRVLKFDLERPGRYKSISFVVPDIDKLKVREPFVAALANGLFDVGYAWLYEAIARAVARATDDTTRALYDFVHTVVGAKHLLEGFWFTALVPGKGSSKGQDILLLGEQAAELTIRAALRTAAKVGKNPAEVVTEVFAEVVDLEDSPMINLCKTGKPLNLNLRSGNYFQNNTSFNLALQAVYGSTMTMFPIVTEGEILVAALFKIENSEDLIKILTSHRRELHEIASRKSTAVDTALGIIRRIRKVPDDTMSKIVDLGGNFAGSMLSSFLRGFLR